MKPSLKDPLVVAARTALEKVWIDLGKPSPLERVPELEAARSVYHAVLNAADLRWSSASELKLVKR